MQTFIHQMHQWDTRVFYWMFGGPKHRAWRRIFYGLSRSADCVSCAVLGGIWYLCRPSDLPYLLAAFAAFACELTLYYILKKNIKRPRPFRKFQGVRNFIAPPDEFGFPSGHTAAAFLMAFLLAAAWPAIAVPAFLWAGCVGFSRVYLGVHYPTDVLAGVVLGLTSAQAGLWAIHLVL